MNRFRGITALVLAATLLTGCAAQTQESIAPDLGAGTSKEFVGAPGAIASDAIGTVDRSVIKTGSIGFETTDIDGVKTKLTQLATGHEGLIENWDQQSNNAGELWLVNATVRVPAEHLDMVIEEISGYGELLSLNVNNTDVTTQVLDIDARVEALQASVARLKKLMADATSTADLLAAETALAQRQAELDSLLQQQKYLKDSVSMSTLYVSAYAEGRGPVSAPTDFVDGLQEGWRAMLAFFTGTVVFAGVMTPWLLIALPIGAIVFVIIRRIRVKAKRSQ